MYDFIYENEKELKNLERALKGINLLTYKKLFYEVYPNLKKAFLSMQRKKALFMNLNYQLMNCLKKFILQNINCYFKNKKFS